ncbi:hypothetical protein G7046_g4294 [Stylonectria norvegica]|nr:hypothetical protein G7046_g4294 [Stylonectria norvegica]
MPNSQVPLRKLGKNGPSVAALGFGLMGLTHKTYGASPDEEERFAILDRAVEIGATFWDSSDLYGDGEEFLNKWFKRTGKRDEIFLATKFGFVKNSPTYALDSSADYCKKACNESLRILGVDSIDLYYLHFPNGNTPIEETMRALAELQAEGKIKHIGLCGISSSALRRAVKIAPVAAVQTDYSAVVRDIESSVGTNLLATCRELGVALVAAMPLGRGLLTANFASDEVTTDSSDLRPHMMPRFMEGNRETNVKLVAQFKEFADKKGCTTAQLAIAWLLKQGDDIIPIPGTKKIKYLEENWAALNVHLTDAEETEIRSFLESAEIARTAQPAQFASYTFTDTVEEA